MRRTILLLLGALSLFACAHDGADSAATAPDAVSGGTVGAVNGEKAYREHCAGCHETGMLGAPVAGDAEDWASRSQLWDAVLLDHAITGYLEMPARGGRMDLPDEVVKAAADYMLEITFPDLPRDCNPPVCGDIQD